MRCNPSYWLLGLVPMAILSWVAVQLEHEGIEADLGRRSQEILSRKGLDWAVPQFSGRDGVLTGKASDDKDPPAALAGVRDTWGVRVVDQRAELLELADKYLWSATLRDGRVALSGYVPSQDVRAAVLAAAKNAFPKSEIIDEMKLARGAPDLDAWMSGINFGLKQLAQLKRGNVDLEALNLSIAGEAATSPAYKSVKTALASAMPGAIKLVNEKITPPLANPFVWSATSQGNQLLMSGFVPSDKTREELFGFAKRSFPKLALVDRTDVADGAPDGFARAAAASLSQLAALKSGTADIKGKDLTFIGEATDEPAANTVRNALKAEVPPAFKITEQIKYPKATGPYVMSISNDGKAIEVGGMVPSEAARIALIDAVKTRFPGAAITDKTQVIAGAPEGWQHCIVSGLAVLPRLKTGQAVLTDRKLLVSGTTDDAAIAQALPNEVKISAGQACETATDITFNGSLTWHARHGEDGALVLEGDVPDEASRAKIKEAAAQLWPQAKLTDGMKIVPVAMAGWNAMTLRGLEQLARLKHGDASLTNHELTLRGLADSEAVAGEVRSALGRDLPQGFAARDQIEVKKIEVIAEADKCQELLTEASSGGVINFTRASAELTGDSTFTLNVVAEYANACPAFRIEIGGHTDNEGTDERNQRLSDRRAKSVAAYLTSAGVDTNRLSAVGYGASKPVADNTTPQGRAQNRRIEFTVKVN